MFLITAAFMINIDLLGLLMGLDASWYFLIALGAGFAVGLRELFFKKSQVKHERPVEDEGIGVLWDTLPPQLKIQKVKLKIQKEDIAPPPVKKTYKLKSIQDRIDKKSQDKLELTRKILNADSNLENLEAHMVAIAIKRKECLEVVSAINSFNAQYGKPTDESLSDGLDVMDQDELVIRMEELTTILENLQNEKVEEKSEKSDKKKEIDLKDRDEKILENLTQEVEDLKLRAEIKEAIDRIYKELDDAITVEELEAIDTEVESFCATRSLTQYKEERLRRVRSEEEFLRLKEEIPEIESLETLCEIDLSMFTPSMGARLDELIETRKNELILMKLEEIEGSKFKELDELISKAKSVEELDEIDLSDVNDSSKKILLGQVFKRAQRLLFEAAKTEIDFIESPLEIDSVILPDDLGQQYIEKLERIKTQRRELLVEGIRLSQQEEAFNEYKAQIEEISDVHELRELNFFNINMSQLEALELLRRELLDKYQEDSYSNLKTAIDEATELEHLEAIEITGMNIEQTAVLEQMLEETRERLGFEFELREGFEAARQSSPGEEIPFDPSVESEFISRMERYDTRNRAIQFSLLWNNRNDFDILVKCPSGSLIYSGRDSPCGGSVDLEMNEDKAVKKPLEHVIWDANSASEGVYEVYAWYRERKARDKTEFTVRIADGPDVTYYRSSIGENDKMKLAATIELNSDEIRNSRIEENDTAFRSIDSAIKSASNVEELPEIEGPIHSKMQLKELEDLHQERKEYLLGVEEREIRNQKLERKSEIALLIRAANTIEELESVEISDVLDRDASRLGKLVKKRRKAIERNEVREQRRGLQQNYQSLLSTINAAESNDDLEDLPELELSDKDAKRIHAIFEAKVQSFIDNAVQIRQDENSARYQLLIDNAENLSELVQIEIEDVSDKEGRRLLRLLELRAADLQAREQEEVRAEEAEERVKKMLTDALKGSDAKTTSGSDRDEEIIRRMRSEGAEDGVLSVSLIWDNLNDLDLLLVDPNDEVIYAGRRMSSTGGVLDVDMNSKPQSKKAIENIFWESSPPEGKYHVFVHHYHKHVRLFDNDPTEYNIRINFGPNGSGEALQSSGSLSSGDPAKHVATFQYPYTAPSKPRKKVKKRTKKSDK